MTDRGGSKCYRQVTQQYALPLPRRMSKFDCDQGLVFDIVQFQEQLLLTATSCTHIVSVVFVRFHYQKRIMI
jgi:hypothetical protein